MKRVLASAGRAFLAAFGVTIVVYAPGVLQAPDLNQMYLLGVAALGASVSAGLKAIKEFVPQLSFSAFLPQPWAAWVDAFVIGGLGALVVAVTAWLDAPDLELTRAALVAILVGAGTAAFRALEGLLTKGEQPAQNKGL